MKLKKMNVRLDPLRRVVDGSMSHTRDNTVLDEKGAGEERAAGAAMIFNHSRARDEGDSMCFPLLTFHQNC
jgi:hypothetical protein